MHCRITTETSVLIYIYRFFLTIKKHNQVKNVGGIRTFYVKQKKNINK